MKYICIGESNFHMVEADSKLDAWDVIESAKPLFDCKAIFSELYISQMHSLIQRSKFEAPRGWEVAKS